MSRYLILKYSSSSSSSTTDKYISNKNIKKRMFDWLKKRKLKKKLEAISKTSVYEQTLDEELKQTAKDYALKVRDLDKMRKLIEAKRRINDIDNAVGRAHEALTKDDFYDDDDDDDDDDDELDEVDKEIKALLLAPLKAKMAQNSQVAAAVPPSSPANLSPLKKSVIDKLMIATDEDILKFLNGKV